MATDAQVLDWLLRRISYVEHKDVFGTLPMAQPAGEGYWPTTPETDSDPNDEYVGLTLREYVELQIKKELA